MLVYAWTTSELARSIATSLPAKIGLYGATAPHMDISRTLMPACELLTYLSIVVMASRPIDDSSVFCRDALVGAPNPANDNFSLARSNSARAVARIASIKVSLGSYHPIDWEFAVASVLMFTLFGVKFVGCPCCFCLGKEFVDDFLFGFRNMRGFQDLVGNEIIDVDVLKECVQRTLDPFGPFRRWCFFQFG